MHLRHALAGLLLVLSCAEDAFGSHALRRQDTNGPTTTVQSTPSPSPTESRSQDGSSATSTDRSLTSDHSADPTPLSSEPGLQTNAISTPVVKSPDTSSRVSAASQSADPDDLPIEPKITPAIGIAGVILIIAGVALCLVGIKHAWLYIFLSTALLASLAVTVLIIYVMNPPVSDAVQGAFLVASVLTGVILGAVSIIFKDITDSLGSLLGGFCFAMWLLVLSPGGIISSTAGRGILIGVMCAGFFILSFSHHTRTYGLIVCTSFSGATATVVGVDCFSRAGLKEFWIYLWDLNDDEFPLGTETYPITRGIRVEIACTIVLFVFGLMSQFKIWKLVKERRKKKDVERRKKDEEREELEAAVGRDIEAANQKELADWEATYGDKNATQVHVGSEMGSSDDTTKRESSGSGGKTSDGYELEERPAPIVQVDEKDKSRPSVTIRQALHDSQEAGCSRDNLLKSANVSRSESGRSTTRSSRAATETGSDMQKLDESEYPSDPNVPPVQPLPFKVPQSCENSDANSAFSQIPDEITLNREPPHPLEQFALSKHLDPHKSAVSEDDRASSVAATADEENDIRPLSRAGSVYEDIPRIDQSVTDSDNGSNRSQSPAGEAEEDELLEEHDEEALTRPVAAPDEHLSQTRRSSSAKSRRQSIASRHSKSRRGSGSDNRSISEGLVEQLPPQLSRIAQTYRTNEWAKHIADADAPEAEEAAEPHSPGVQVDIEFAREAAKPVDVEALQQGYNDPQTMPRHSSKSSQNPRRRSEQQPALTRNSSTQSTNPAQPLSSRPSTQSFNRQNSSASARPALTTNNTGTSAIPLASQPLIESPVETSFVAPDPQRPNLSYRASTNTLMDQRHHQIQQRPTITSFNAPPSNPNFNVIAPSNASTSPRKNRDSDVLSMGTFTPGLANDEDMTLAQRRNLVQQQQRRISNPGAPPTSLLPPTPSRQNTSKSLKPRNSVNPSPSPGLSAPGAPPTSPLPPTPSRQNTSTSLKPRNSSNPSPSPSPALTQSNRLAQWRESLQTPSNPHTPNPHSPSKSPAPEESARQTLLATKRQSQAVQARKQEEKGARESYMEAAMRNGALAGAHRDAMRKMQAQARRTSGM